MIGELIAVVLAIIAFIAYFIFPRERSMGNRPGTLSIAKVPRGEVPAKCPMDMIDGVIIPPRGDCGEIAKMPRGDSTVTNCPVGNLPQTLNCPQGNLPQTLNCPQGNLPQTLNCPQGNLPQSCLRQTPFAFDRPRSPRRTRLAPVRILRANDSNEAKVRIANTNKRVSFADMRKERHIAAGQIREFYSRV